MDEPINRTPINMWADDDRPREKLLNKGRTALSDSELLAILIGSGSKEESAIDLCKRVINDCDNNLYELGKRNVHELMKYKGIGEAKAITIVAALELGRRRKQTDAIKRDKISSSQDVFLILKEVIGDINHEEFWILLLNRANKVLSRERISIGGVSGTMADAKVIFKIALDKMASSIILAHNHPSGNNRPSESDIRLTKKIVEAGKIIEISVLDHVIIAENNYYSFADEGKI